MNSRSGRVRVAMCNREQRNQCRLPLVRLAERVVTKANHDKEIRLDWDVRRFGDRQHAPNVVGRRRDLIFWSSALTGRRRHWNLGWLPYKAGDSVCLTTASGLLPAGTAI